MKSSTYTNIKLRDKPNDKIYTPQSLLKIHLELLTDFVKDGDIVFDAFYGDGRYYNLFPEYFKNNNFDYTEIDLNKDFFLYDKQVDVIISNPPYSMIDKVLEKSIELNPHTISYLIGQHNLTNKRIEFMNGNGYYLVKLHFTKVYQWFGMSAIVVFCKNGINCISYDRQVHK